MKSYEYRVTAINDGGESDPSEGSKPIKAKKLKEAPKVSRVTLVTSYTSVRFVVFITIDSYNIERLCAPNTLSIVHC